MLLQVARTSLRTKLDVELADKLTEAIVDAVMAIKQEGEEINLHMVEIMEMQHRSVRVARFSQWLVEYCYMCVCVGIGHAADSRFGDGSRRTPPRHAKTQRELPHFDGERVARVRKDGSELRFFLQDGGRARKIGGCRARLHRPTRAENHRL